jgi:DNA primase
MITADTINLIKETAQIDEVVGDFVQLKKRGARFLGRCPFHNEKTPSFTVTPALNIYKCFGCGASGDPVKFVMEHEKFSYPEALKYLAQKYNIEVEESTPNKEQLEVTSEKEQLHEINSFAQKFFTHYLLEQEAGKSIGLTYFKERGLTEDTIKKFQLGFAPEEDNKLLTSALSSNFNFELLKKAGLAAERSNRQVDFFRARVMFPIHSVSGKVIAFGGRILKKDSGPKYINTPETEVYHKSQILYGIFQAKGAIRKLDECILTEGYMDVIALAQAGIDNAVASSGTSLTIEQVKLVKRLTPNITILYDGDPAGIKAALRGIDIILEEDMNVKIVLLPEPEDPDSYIQKYGAQQFLEYKEKNGKDFILFKAELLLKDIHNDPVKKSGVIKDIVQSIALIPDIIKRSMYTAECSALLKIDEQILVSEINKIKRTKLAKETNTSKEEYIPLEDTIESEPQDVLPDRMEYLEKDIIRLLFEYAYEAFDEESTIIDHVLHQIEDDKFEFSNTIYKTILQEYRVAYDSHNALDQKYFLTHPNEAINKLAFEMLNKPYEISENWFKKHNVIFTEKQEIIKKDLLSIVYKLKIEIINRKIEDFDTALRNTENETEVLDIVQKKQTYLKAKVELAKQLGSVFI